MKNYLYLIISVLAALALTGCGEASKDQKNPRKVKCVEVESYQKETSEVRLSGKVTAASESNLSFRVAGIIDKIIVKEGQKVSKGQVIALLDSRDYQLQLDATQAEYDAIKAEVDRVVALYNQNSVSANDYDKATNGLKQITAKLSAHKNALEDTKLRAPYSGTIQKTIFDRGEAVSAGMPVVSIVATSEPEVIVNLPAKDYLRLSKLLSSSAAMEHLEDINFPLSFIGSSPKANLNQLYETRFLAKSVEGTTPSIGMSAVVTLNFEVEDENLLLIPLSAVTQRDDKSMVWVYSDGSVTARPITISEIKSNGTAVITEGLSQGEMVISAGINSLSEGQKVTPLEAASKTNIGGVL